MEGALIHLQQEPDEELNAYVEDLIDQLIANQESDGYLNSFFIFLEPQNKSTNLKVRHELYCAGHLLEAALEHLKLHGASRFFEAMERYIDHIAQTFGPEPEKRSVRATFIPYFLWANRGENEMLVWINEN